MGMFQFSIADGQITNRLPKLQDGFSGVVQINRTEISKTRQGDKFFANFTVVVTNDETKHPVGKMYSWGQSLLDPNIAKNAMKQFLTAVCGVKADDEAAIKALEPSMDAIIGAAVQSPDQNQLCSRYVRVETFEKTTGNNRPFMNHNWSAYVG